MLCVEGIEDFLRILLGVDEEISAKSCPGTP
jgi:hypothetical protein